MIRALDSSKQEIAGFFWPYPSPKLHPARKKLDLLIPSCLGLNDLAERDALSELSADLAAGIRRVKGAKRLNSVRHNFIYSTGKRACVDRNRGFGSNRPQCRAFSVSSSFRRQIGRASCRERV